MPRLVSVKPIVAFSPTTRKSHASASSSPPPNAAPGVEAERWAGGGGRGGQGGGKGGRERGEGGAWEKLWAEKLCSTSNHCPMLLVQAGAPTVVSRLSLPPRQALIRYSTKRDHQRALPVLIPRTREVGWSVVQEEPRACRPLVHATIEKCHSREKVLCERCLSRLLKKGRGNPVSQQSPMRATEGGYPRANFRPR